MTQQSTAAAHADAALTPTETVLVHADRFAPKDTVLTDGLELLLAPGKVAVRPLVDTLFAIALLANERAGALRMEIRPRKALFGLMTRHPLVVEPTGASARWPEGSLEDQVLRHLGGRAREVGELLYDLMEEDSGGPAYQAVFLVKRSLHARGLMEEREKRTLKILKTTELAASAPLAGAAAAADWRGEEALLRDFQARRAAEWETLRRAVGSTLGRRREDDDD